MESGAKLTESASFSTEIPAISMERESNAKEMRAISNELRPKSPAAGADPFSFAGSDWRIGDDRRVLWKYSRLFPGEPALPGPAEILGERGGGAPTSLLGQFTNKSLIRSM
jgi:hypothetical protein